MARIKKIVICGKGYSYKYFEKHLIEYDVTISYNHEQDLNKFDFNFFSKNKEKSSKNGSSTLLESNINESLNLNEIFIGSTTYGLYSLLGYISHEYPDSEVHLVGFDNRYIYENDESEFDVQSFINVESQRILHKKIDSFYENLSVKMVGFELFSFIDAKTGKLPVENESNKVEIVAEITTNHFGDTERLIKMIQLSKKAGADSVKFQIRDVESFYSNHELNKKFKSPFGETFKDYRLAIELTDEQLSVIHDLCNDLGIKYFFSVLDWKSFLKIQSLGINRIKLPSTISNNRSYITNVLENYTGEVVISTGMTNEEYLDFLMSTKSSYEKLYLLHCISSYPTNIYNLILKTIQRYSQYSNKVIPGYSSHDIGSLGSMCAVFSGAKMIEKHVKLGNTNFGHFDETAMDLEMEFEEFVKHIRSAEYIYGSSTKTIFSSEHHKYQ